MGASAGFPTPQVCLPWSLVTHKEQLEVLCCFLRPSRYASEKERERAREREMGERDGGEEERNSYGACVCCYEEHPDFYTRILACGWPRSRCVCWRWSAQRPCPSATGWIWLWLWLYDWWGAHRPRVPTGRVPTPAALIPPPTPPSSPPLQEPPLRNGEVEVCLEPHGLRVNQCYQARLSYVGVWPLRCTFSCGEEDVSLPHTHHAGRQLRDTALFRFCTRDTTDVCPQLRLHCRFAAFGKPPTRLPLTVVLEPTIAGVPVALHAMLLPLAALLLLLLCWIYPCWLRACTRFPTPPR